MGVGNHDHGRHTLQQVVGAQGAAPDLLVGCHPGQDLVGVSRRAAQPGEVLQASQNTGLFQAGEKSAGASGGVIGVR